METRTVIRSSCLHRALFPVLESRLMFHAIVSIPKAVSQTVAAAWAPLLVAAVAVLVIVIAN